MLSLLVGWLFGCSHPDEKMGFPITRKNITYRVCTQCGKERKYNWKTMKYEKLTVSEVRRLRPEELYQEWSD